MLIVLKSESPNIQEPSGPPQACIWDFFFFYILINAFVESQILNNNNLFFDRWQLHLELNWAFTVRRTLQSTHSEVPSETSCTKFGKYDLMDGQINSEFCLLFYVVHISCNDFIQSYNFNTILTRAQLLIDVCRVCSLLINIYLLLSVQFSICRVTSQSRHAPQCYHNSNKTVATCGTLQPEHELWPELLTRDVHALRCSINK